MMRSLSSLLSALEAQIGPAGLVALLFGLTALLGLILGVSLMGALGAARRRRALREAEEEQELLQNLLNDTRLHGSRLQSENSVLKSKIDGVSRRDAKHDREIRRLSTELKAAHISLEAKENELSKKDRLLQEQSEAAVGFRSDKHALDSAVQDAKEKGRAEGLEAGRKQGREEAQKLAATNKQREGTLSTAAGLGASGSISAAGAQNLSEPPTLIKRVRRNEEDSLNTTETGIIPDDQIIPILPEAELTANVEAYDLSDLEDLVNEDL